MTRRTFIERTLRQIYNGMPSDDSEITYNLVNIWLSDGIGAAAKKNYTDNFQLEGVGFVNNSFYSTFKGIVIEEEDRNLYTATLPQLPFGIGQTDGTPIVIFKDGNKTLSYPAVMLSENQVGIQRQMRRIPNKIICYTEGIYLKIITSIIMTPYTVNATLVSGGDANDLDSELNIPADYMSVCVEYIKSQLLFERKMIPDLANDGQDD